MLPSDVTPRVMRLRPGDLFDIAWELGGEPRGEAERTIAAWFESASPREITTVAAAARVAFWKGVWRPYEAPRGPVPPERLAVFAPEARLAIASLLSLHRNGWLRELAVKTLVASNDPRVVPFLLLRADDIVPAIRAVAEAALLASLDRLDPSRAPAFARALGLVALLAARVRGSGGLLVRAIRERLLDPACREALVAASRDADRRVRRTAFALRLGSERSAVVLSEALADPDTAIRRWAARTALTKGVSAEDKRALVPLLAASRAYGVRLVALRVLGALGPEDDAPFEAALLDSHVVVRQFARSALRARRPERPFGETRARALGVLASSAPEARALVGALGALSDVGTAADVPAVAPFAHDARPRVRGEARRTLALLTR